MRKLGFVLVLVVAWMLFVSQTSAQMPVHTNASYVWFTQDTLVPDNTYWSSIIPMKGYNNWAVYLTYDSMAVSTGGGTLSPLIGFSPLFSDEHYWMGFFNSVRTNRDSFIVSTTGATLAAQKAQIGRGFQVVTPTPPTAVAAYSQYGSWDYVRFRWFLAADDDSVWNLTAIIRVMQTP